MGIRKLHFCFLFFLIFIQACSSSPPPPDPAEDLEAAFAGFFAWNLTGDIGRLVESSERLTRAMESGKLNDKQLGVAYYVRGCSQNAGAYAPYEAYAKAIADFEKSIELYPDFEGHPLFGNATTKCAMAYVDRGQKYDSDKKPEQALKDANKAIEICPRSHRGYELRGNLFKAKGLLDLALADFDIVIEKWPSPKAYYSRGFAWLHKGNYDSAIADFTSAIELYDKPPPGVKIDHSEVKRSKKRFPEAYYVRAWAYQAKGELEKALADAQIAFDAKPTDNDYQLLLDRIKNRISEEREHARIVKETIMKNFENWKK